ncbi:GNAT family N-acetyltransferase [Thalassospira sp. NFXS8]|uniref:GNAT family N-acetyltransferase n=1 Tax=Thalassospira sp. NFXS8 TaxID=2819093 RepID=UPI0032DF2DBA
MTQPPTGQHPRKRQHRTCCDTDTAAPPHPAAPDGAAPDPGPQTPHPVRPPIPAVAKPENSAPEQDIIIERLSLENAADCDAVINLWYDGDLINPDTANARAHDDLQNCYASGRGSVLIARQSPKRPVIATIMVGHDSTTGWVHYLVVASRARGQGHGATLLETAENILSAVGLKKCKVHAASPRAAKFYRRQGYRPSMAPAQASPLGDDGFFEKRLTS